MGLIVLVLSIVWATMAIWALVGLIYLRVYVEKDDPAMSWRMVLTCGLLWPMVMVVAGLSKLGWDWPRAWTLRHIGGFRG